MSSLIGALTLASTLAAVMLGQIGTGAPVLGVVLASVVLMTVRA